MGRLLRTIQQQSQIAQGLSRRCKSNEDKSKLMFTLVQTEEYLQPSVGWRVQLIKTKQNSAANELAQLDAMLDDEYNYAKLIMIYLPQKKLEKKQNPMSMFLLSFSYYPMLEKKQNSNLYAPSSFLLLSNIVQRKFHMSSNVVSGPCAIDVKIVHSRSCKIRDLYYGLY